MVLRTLLLLSAVAGPALAANKDTERLYLQIAALQSEVGQLRRTTEDSLKEIRRLNEVLAEQTVFVKKSIQDQQRQAEAAQLTIKELNDTVAGLRDRLQAAATAPPVASFNELPDASNPSGTPSNQAAGTIAASPPAGPAPAAGELYTQAYADCARGNYDLGIQGFQEYLKHYPSAHLSDNAQYWIGECLYGKRDYAAAVAAWDELLRQYPGTDKIPDARYKKAMALEKLGRRSQALLEYRYVFEHFPNSEAGRKAREKVQAQ
jgi:tol-pal system protein YbgF